MREIELQPFPSLVLGQHLGTQVKKPRLHKLETGGSIQDIP